MSAMFAESSPNIRIGDLALASALQNKDFPFEIILIDNATSSVEVTVANASATCASHSTTHALISPLFEHLGAGSTEND
jgi:hypothetical protein